jgi:hypothetical protein
MLYCKPLETGEAVALRSSRLEIVILERGSVLEQPLVGFSVVECGTAQFTDAGGLERLLHLGVGAEGACPIAQRQIQLHVGACRRPDTVDVLGAQRFVVEVPIPVIGRASAGCPVFQQIDSGKGLQQVAVAEDQVLVIAGTFLPVEVDVEQLPRPQRLGDAVGVVEASAARCCWYRAGSGRRRGR